jgi:hypothetical protein
MNVLDRCGLVACSTTIPFNAEKAPICAIMMAFAQAVFCGLLLTANPGNSCRRRSGAGERARRHQPGRICSALDLNDQFLGARVKNLDVGHSLRLFNPLCDCNGIADVIKAVV